MNKLKKLIELSDETMSKQRQEMNEFSMEIAHALDLYECNIDNMLRLGVVFESKSDADNQRYQLGARRVFLRGWVTFVSSNSFGH